MSQNIPGLFKATVRAPIRNKPGKYVIGTLYGGEFFYAEHLHDKKVGPDWWVWGYTGGEFRYFGWVSRTHLASVPHNKRPEEEKYAQIVQRFLKDHRHRERDITHWATTPLPTGNSAQGYVKVHQPISLYGNRSCKRVIARLFPAPPGGRQKRLSWRYILKGRKTHLVVYHPDVDVSDPPNPDPRVDKMPDYGKGKWGFIKNDSSITVIDYRSGKQVK